VSASLQLLSAAPDRISFPLLAGVYRAALGAVPFSLFLSGNSGVFKTALAALAQQHFGAAMDGSGLPANFASTANALEGLAFAAKDALLVVSVPPPVMKMAFSESFIEVLHPRPTRATRRRPLYFRRTHFQSMAALIDAINVKKKTLFELDDIPYACLEAEVNTPTARGGQTLVRLKIRNLLTNAVFEKTFKAGDKFREPDLILVDASYLYSDSAGSHFLDQQSFETHSLAGDVVGDALDFLIEGALLELLKFNGNPIGLKLPPFVELQVASTEPGVRGDSSSGSVTKAATLETGLEIRVPLFIKEGEKVTVSTESRSFAGRA